jgi:hypothetical protein
MSLVADDQLVRALRNRVHVAREPCIRLDRDRVAAQRLLAVLDRRAKPVAVAFRRQVVRELLYEQAAVREDEDAHRPRALDEAGGGDRLAGSGGVAEPEAADSPGILLGCGLAFVVLDLLVLPLLVVFGLLVRVAVGVTVAVLGLFLVPRDQLGQHSGERVDLVAAELGAGGEPRRTVGQLPFEAEHERVADLPGGRGRSPAGLHLLERVVERATARAALRKRLGRFFVWPEEGLARPLFGALSRGGQAVRFHPRKGPLVYRFVHRVQRGGAAR